MHHIIEALWHGNIEPMESVGSHPAYREKARALLEAEREFCALLNEKEQAMLESLCNLRTEMECVAQEIVFTQGFRLGARLFWECLSDD